MPRKIKVKSLTTIKENYIGSTTEAARRYKEAAKTVEVVQASKDAQETYVKKMSDPTVLARRLKGLEGVSDADIRKAMDEQGAPIIGARMKAAAQDQVDGYSVIREALDGLEVPDRVDDWEANIDNIQKKVVKAMVDASLKKYE